MADFNGPPRVVGRRPYIPDYELMQFIESLEAGQFEQEAGLEVR